MSQNIARLFALLLGLGFGASCATNSPSAGPNAANTSEQILPDQPPVTLGCAFRDFNGDGKLDTLSVIWVSGNHVIDSDLWCGSGERYEGQFIFRVELAGGATVDTTFASLKVPVDSFAADDKQPWEIVVSDYNNNGQPDFNLTAYAGCNYDTCYLFAVLPSGKVESLAVEGNDGLTIRSGSGHSTDEFDLTPTGFYYELGAPSRDELDLEFLDWDPKQQLFHRREEKIPLRP